MVRPALSLVLVASCAAAPRAIFAPPPAQHQATASSPISAPPERPRPTVTNALLLPGRALVGQGPAVQLPRAWLTEDELVVTVAQGANAMLRGTLARHQPTAPFAAIASHALGAPEALAAFVQAAFSPTHAAVVYVDVTRGVRDSRIAFLPRRPAAGVNTPARDQRLGHTYSTYPAVEYNAQLRQFGVLWSHGEDLRFTRFDADGAPVPDSSVLVRNREFTWSNGARFVSTEGGWAALVRDTAGIAMEIVEFDASARARAQPTVLSQSGSPIESSLSWDGQRFGLAWSTNEGFFVMLQRSPNDRTQPVRVANREHFGGAPSLVFDGTHHVLVWGDNPGRSRVHLARIHRDGTLLSNTLFASHPTEHCYFAFASVGGASRRDVVVTYQVGEQLAYVAPITQ